MKSKPRATGHRKVAKWAIALGLLSLFGTPVLLTYVQLRQEALDRALVAAVKNLDAGAVNRLLVTGASPNAIVTSEQKLNLRESIQHVFERLQHRRYSNSTSDQKSILTALLDWDNTDLSNINPARDTIGVMLIRRGADIHFVERTHRDTPLHLAAYHRLHQTVRVLLTRSVDVNARDDANYTPLMFADADCAAQIAEHGADMDARSLLGMTALMYAVSSVRDHSSLARVLVQHGANVNANDFDGLSVLYYALDPTNSVPDRSAIVRMLKEHGARLNNKDKEALIRKQ